MNRNRFVNCALTATLLAAGVATACESPTAPAAVPLSLEIVRWETQEEVDTWPSKAVIEGGDVVQIRGLGRSGCGTLAATASRRGEEIDVRIVAAGDYSPCPLSKWAWDPFSVTIDALTPGRYHIRVAVAGHADRARADVDVF